MFTLEDREAGTGDDADSPGIEADSARRAEPHLQVGVGLLGKSTERTEGLLYCC